MKKFLVSIICLLASAVVIYSIFCGYKTMISNSLPSNYVVKVSSESSNLSIRVLCLKHCYESMASGDTKLVIEAVSVAKTSGLRVSEIGDFFINREGQTRISKVVYDSEYSPDGLKDFISQQMKVNAEPDDTLIVFTVGHGSPQGDLQNIGQRADLFKIIASAAEENNQLTVWWQLSCFASASLPEISSLPERQQNLLSVVASADSHTESPAGVEGGIIQKVFTAIANHDPVIDPDNSGIITAGKLKDFLNKIKPGRGNLVYAKSLDQVLFGCFSIVRLIPIFDPGNPNLIFPKEYIPLPGR